MIQYLESIEKQYLLYTAGDKYKIKNMFHTYKFNNIWFKL
jgi:hypothetical protein